MPDQTAQGTGPDAPARPHRRRPAGRLWVLALLVAGAGLLAASAGIHLHLWSAGYRFIPTIGPLFMAQAITGFALAALVVLTRHPLVALAGAAFLASTIGGLVLSAWVGLFGFHDSYDAPFAGTSLVVEATGVVVLGLAALIGWRQRGASRRPSGSGRVDRHRETAVRGTG